MGAIVLTNKDRAEIADKIISSGLFVTCGQKTPNIMVTHQGMFGQLWGREVFMLPIKSTKYSYQIVTQTKSFALNVPARDMSNAIAQCDVISGFKCNKFEALNLHPKRARSIEAYVLGECGLIVEFNVVAIIPPEAISQTVDGLFPARGAHTLFVGEVCDRYRLR